MGVVVRVGDSTYSLSATAGSTNPDDALSAEVNWGDGGGFRVQGVSINPGTGAISASHVYLTPGIYPVQVRVSNGQGSTSIDTASAQVPDERFGVIDSGPALGSHLATLGVGSFIDYTWQTNSVPAGATKIPFVDIAPGATRLTPAQIAQTAANSPGATWYLGGEPNVPKRGITPANYITEFDYYVNEIKAADPTARIMSPSILNWDIPCIGCGLTAESSGENWLTEFVETYMATHGGQKPPVDVWAIDVFPLDWTREKLPQTDWLFVADQIRGLRDYLNGPPLFAFSAPIWVTETGSHWAYTDWEVAPNGGATLPPDLDWVEDFQWDALETKFLIPFLNWLRVNSGQLRIEKWFFFKAYVSLSSQAQQDAYAGLHFLDSPGSDANLNQLGQVYRDYSLGMR